jgi:predicted nucleotidyltransferase
LAEDTTKPKAADQTKEQNPCCMGMMGKDMGNMMGMDMGNMMSNRKDQEAELDKLVADMNSAPSDKKVDAIAAVVTKLVEQRKAMHERMQKMMTEGRNEMMKMGRMMMMMRMMDRMMGNDKEEGEHSQHH